MNTVPSVVPGPTSFNSINLVVMFFKMIFVIVMYFVKPVSTILLVLFVSFAPYIFIVSLLSPFAIVLLIVALILRIRFFRKQVHEEAIFLELVPSGVTLQSHFSTQQLFTTLHRVTEPSSWIDHQIGNKRTMSFELVSTKQDGIRYIVKTSPHNANLVKKNIRSFLPEVEIREIEDYLPQSTKDIQKPWHIVEIKLGKHVAIPLVSQSQLDEHDPIAYLTGHMTQLSEEDLISMQLVVTPVYSNTHPKYWEDIGIIRSSLKRGKDISPHIYRSKNLLKNASKALLLFMPKLILFLALVPFQLLFYFFSSDKRVEPLPFQVFSLLSDSKTNEKELSNEERLFQQSVGDKVKSELYEASLRFFIIADTYDEVDDRVRGLVGALAPFESSYQWLETRHNTLIRWLCKIPAFNARYFSFVYVFFKHRLLSLRDNPLFSVAEVASLYHFPYSSTTKTEGVLKLKSPNLPAPLSQKRGFENFNVVFAYNTYGGVPTPIGLLKEDRRRHVYIIGKTGSGKTTLLSNMIYSDIVNGEGLCVIDPHGDLSEMTLNYIPKEREQDLIYFNPDDIERPIRINLLELTPGLNHYDALREKEFITESVISLFRKVFATDFHGSGNPHRIEYVLRNTIHTAFTVPDCTLFTVFDLLTNPVFRQKVIEKLTDQHLKNFWIYEFGKAGDYQQVKWISPITARIGRFLFSPSAEQILREPKSTINFDEIMDEGKNLICNLSKGKLGEDTSQVLGIMIQNKIQLAALKRARIDVSKRKDFYLYVDEFQHFATSSFVEMLSEARKYKLNLIMAEQSTSQQKDTTLINIILANVGTVISFGSGNPADEDLLLRQFAPHVKKGDIANLHAFHFYIKISAINPDDVFSGETIVVPVTADRERLNHLIELSRNTYGTPYVKKTVLAVKEEKNTSKTKANSTVKKTNGSVNKSNGTPRTVHKKRVVTSQETPKIVGLPENQ